LRSPPAPGRRVMRPAPVGRSETTAALHWEKDKSGRCPLPLPLAGKDPASSSTPPKRRSPLSSAPGATFGGCRSVRPSRRLRARCPPSLPGKIVRFDVTNTAIAGRQILRRDSVSEIKQSKCKAGCFRCRPTPQTTLGIVSYHCRTPNVPVRPSTSHVGAPSPC